MQEIIALQIQKDLELKLIAEIQEKSELQELEKKIEEEEVSQEEFEEKEESVREYGSGIEGAYSQKGEYNTGLVQSEQEYVNGRRAEK